MSSLNPFATPFIPDTDMNLVSMPIVKPTRSVLKYPFSYIRGSKYYNGWCNNYKTSQFSGGLVAEEPCDVGKFPDNISDIYWFHEGKNDEDAWLLLCKLDNGNYAFYSAWCDYTGFDCQGGMKLIVSKDIKRLFYDGMTEAQRTLCLKEKKNPIELIKKKNIWGDDETDDDEETDDEEIDEDDDDDKTYDYEGTDDDDDEDRPGFMFVVPEYKPDGATRAYIRAWNDGEELVFKLNTVNGLEMDAIEYAIRGLTSQFLTPKALPGKAACKPKKKFYYINICAGRSVYGIDDYFRKRFHNPDKKWELRMKQSSDNFIRKWGKVEVSFILC